MLKSIYHWDDRVRAGYKPKLFGAVSIIINYKTSGHLQRFELNPVKLNIVKNDASFSFLRDSRFGKQSG